MDCSDAQHLILLDAGGDLRVEEEVQLTEHLSRCGECRVYRAGMSPAMEALRMLRDQPALASATVDAGLSVWPTVSREIQRRRTSPSGTRRFNLQVAALSVCSLSLAVVTMVQSLSTWRETADTSSFVPAQSVSNSLETPRLRPFKPLDVRPAPDEVMPIFPDSGSTLPPSF